MNSTLGNSFGYAASSPSPNKAGAGDRPGRLLFDEPSAAPSQGTAPVSGGFGAPVSGGFGAPVSGGFGAPVSGGFGAPVSGGFGAPVSGGFGAPVSGGFGAPVSGGFGAPVSGGFGAPVSGGFGGAAAPPVTPRTDPLADLNRVATEAAAQPASPQSSVRPPYQSVSLPAAQPEPRPEPPATPPPVLVEMELVYSPPQQEGEDPTCPSRPAREGESGPLLPPQEESANATPFRPLSELSPAPPSFRPFSAPDAPAVEAAPRPFEMAVPLPPAVENNLPAQESREEDEEEAMETYHDLETMEDKLQILPEEEASIPFPAVPATPLVEENLTDCPKKGDEPTQKTISPEMRGKVLESLRAFDKLNIRPTQDTLERFRRSGSRYGCFRSWNPERTPLQAK